MNKNDFPMISIIMPVYNSDKYVAQAIQSVLKQSFEDFELIIVDDGSTDNSGFICDEYAKNDSRIIVLHKQNGGVCSARNVGIEKSKGKYITFIDNDDFYEEGFLDILFNEMEQTNADFIKAGRRNIKISSQMDILGENICTYKEKSILSRSEFAKKYFDIKKSGILSSIWNGLYKRSLIVNSGIRFDESVKHGNEDLIFNCEISLNSDTIEIIPDVIYTHFYRLGHSTSTKFYPDQIRTRLNGVELELQIVKDNREQSDLIILEGIRSCFRMLIPLSSMKERKLYIEEMKSRLDFAVLREYPLLSSKNVSKEGKIDLFLIKHGLYELYFMLRKLRLKLE